MLSIIIPMYNVADMFGRCLQSLEEAVVPVEPVELVFVDDASPKFLEEQDILINFMARCQKYHVTTISHDYNKGLAASRNTGFEASNGDWIMWLDSDDAITPNGIMDRWQWRHPEEYHYGSYDVVNCNGTQEKLVETRILPPFNYADHFNRNIMPVWTGILHREKVLEFNELYRVAEDYDMTLRMALAMPFVSHPEVVMKYTWARAASLTFDSFWGNHMPSCVHESKRKCLERIMANDYSPYADKYNRISEFRKQVIGT